MARWKHLHSKNCDGRRLSRKKDLLTYLKSDEILAGDDELAEEIVCDRQEFALCNEYPLSFDLVFSEEAWLAAGSCTVTSSSPAQPYRLLDAELPGSSDGTRAVDCTQPASLVEDFHHVRTMRTVATVREGEAVQDSLAGTVRSVVPIHTELFCVVVFFSRGELKHDKEMLTSLDALKQAITDLIPVNFRDRVERHDQPDVECFAREVGSFKRRLMRLVHLVGHGSGSGFRWHLRRGNDEGEFQDGPDFVRQLMLQREIVECVFLDGCSMGEMAHMLQQQGMQFVIYWDGNVSDSVCVQFSKFLYEDMFENFPRQWRELFENTCIRARTHFAHTPPSASRHGKIVLLQQTAVLLLYDLLPSSHGAADAAHDDECALVDAGPERNWRYPRSVAMSNQWLSTDPQLNREFELAKLAGLHEKKFLRACGVEVSMTLADGSKVDIGEAVDGTLHGVDAKGMHTQDALCILHGQAPGVAWHGVVPPKPEFCSTDVGWLVEIKDAAVTVTNGSKKSVRKVHWGTSSHANCTGTIMSVDPTLNGAVKLESGTAFANPARVAYEDLWANLPARAAWPNAATAHRAFDHLAEASYLRKLDLWCSQQAQVVAQDRVASVLWPSNGQKKKAMPIVQWQLTRVLKRGLSLTTIADVANAVIAAIQDCGLANDAVVAAAQLAAAAAANMAISAASVDPTKLRPSADNFMSTWETFEASLPANDGHVKQLNTLISCSEDCQQRWWNAVCQLQAVVRRAAYVHRLQVDPLVRLMWFYA